MTAASSKLDASEFRRVLGHLPTGVTVVTAYAADGTLAGMAANSLTSVSLDPPLILICPAKTSTTWPAMREAGTFCVNVMASHHEPLCRTFARRGTDRFADVAWHSRSTGPGLDEALAWLECEIVEEYEAGDHTIVLATVTAIEAATTGGPLVFFKGQYGTFAPTDGDADVPHHTHAIPRAS
ncbi:flavin reductase family protein [Streptomyces sp. NPDC091280]|uniref:flavin reductase family protein n=1 Tax=Streptomyces sp. NPDC091280 TaxID=3365984 RepID=UPI003818A584